MTPLMLAPMLVPIHLVAIGAWVGAIACVSSLCGRARLMADGPEIARLALSLHRRWAVPALLVSFATAIARAAMSPHDYLTAHWVWAGAVFAVAMVAIHIAVGAKAKKVAAGIPQASRRAGLLAFTFALSACAAIALASFRGTLLP